MVGNGVVAVPKPYKQVAHEATCCYLLSILQAHGGNVRASCKAAGISQARLYKTLGGKVVTRFGHWPTFEEWQADHFIAQGQELVAMRSICLKLSAAIQESWLSQTGFNALREILFRHHGAEFTADAMPSPVTDAEP